MEPSEKKAKILIVEDEISLRNALRDKFSREGFSAFDAKDGEAGIAVALRIIPDIILLDVIMPKMDGIAMLKNLRREGGWAKNVPIILLTNLGADNEKVMKEIEGDKAACYLVKSDWAIGDVVGKVKEMLFQK